MSDDRLAFLDELNKKQRYACECKKNVILKACPGSGKTKALTYKLAYTTIINEHSRKLNIAITFTNRAANEIKKRIKSLDIDTSKNWAGTIHQFCLEYVIRPYAMYDGDLSKGYHIIDEYIEEKYLKEIAEELGISERIRFKSFDEILEISMIRDRYYEKLRNNREIDFDMILVKAYKILKENRNIAKAISLVLRSIFVDEYQDTNEMQYQIIQLLYKANLSIQLMFVGDTDQAIYGGLGGVAKSCLTLSEEYETEFEEIILDGCYRSTQKIVDFYKFFQIENYIIKSKSSTKNELSKVYYKNNINSIDLIEVISKIIEKEINSGVPQSEICVLAPQWWLLFPFSKAIKERLPEYSFDAPDITPFKSDPLNLFYVIAKLVFTAPGENTWLRKQHARNVLKILDGEYGYSSLEDSISLYDLLDIINVKRMMSDDGITTYIEVVKFLFKSINIDFESDEKLIKGFDDFLDKSTDRISSYKLDSSTDFFRSCFREKKGIVINSYHGVKGTEFTTVIAYGLLCGYVPSWHLIYDPEKSNEYKEEEVKKILYVISSRAKERVYLFSERGRKTKRGVALKPSNIIQEYSYQYDE
jgi:superfamily I DNA/RNA helicase